MSDKENFDSFPVNLFETLGPIYREGFRFKSSAYRVWFDGKIIKEEKKSFGVEGVVVERELLVEINTNLFSQFLEPRLSFMDISYNRDRVLWVNVNSLKKQNASALSLFYRNSQLARVAISVDNPQVLIEIDGYSMH